MKLNLITGKPTIRVKRSATPSNTPPRNFKLVVDGAIAIFFNRLWSMVVWVFEFLMKGFKVDIFKSIYFVKVTQINYVSRNQLHNTAQWLSNIEFWLELAWLGEKCTGKTLLVIEIFFTLHRYCTVTAQYWCSVSKAKHDQVFSVPCWICAKNSNFFI